MHQYRGCFPLFTCCIVYTVESPHSCIYKRRKTYRNCIQGHDGENADSPGSVSEIEPIALCMHSICLACKQAVDYAQAGQDCGNRWCAVPNLVPTPRLEWQWSLHFFVIHALYCSITISWTLLQHTAVSRTIVLLFFACVFPLFSVILRFSLLIVFFFLQWFSKHLFGNVFPLYPFSTIKSNFFSPFCK